MRRGVWLVMAGVIFLAMFLPELVNRQWSESRVAPRSQVVEQLSRLEQLSAKWNYEILLLESPLFLSYDDLNQLGDRYLNALTALQANPLYDDPQIQASLQQLIERVRTRRQVVEDFKSNSAVIRYSLNYLVFSMTDVESRLQKYLQEKPQLDAQITKILQSMSNALIRQLQTHILTTDELQDSQIEFCVTCPFNLRMEINNFYSHLKLLDEKLLTQISLRNEVTALDTNRLLERLSERYQYLLRNEDLRQRRQQNWLVIGGVALIFVVLLLVVYMRQHRKQQLKSETDPLTLLGNRHRFERLAQQAMQSASSSLHPVGLLFIDLDGFKEVNDRFGHASGDLVLQQMAGKLSAQLRPEDALMRYGGDEFVVLVDQASITRMTRLAEKLNTQGRILVHNMLDVSTSIGGAIYPDQADTLKEWIELADKAMYQAKKQGKNQFVLSGGYADPTVKATTEEA